MEPFDHYRSGIIQALEEESKSLSTTTPHLAVLSNGKRQKTFSGRAVYQFEIPDNFYFAAGMTINCTIGTKLQYSFSALVADLRGQFLFLTFPGEMGEIIPELHCSWNPSEIAGKLLDRWKTLQPSIVCELLLQKMFKNNFRFVTRDPIFPSSFSPSQRTAVQQSFARRISFVIGERKRGKTGVAASLIFNALRDGKKTLYLASTSESLYHCMNEIILLNPSIAEEHIALIDLGLDLQPPLEMEHTSIRGLQIGGSDTDRQKLFQIIVAESDYRAVEELQEKIDEKQSHLAAMQREIETAKEELNRLQSMSMIEKMKLRVTKTTIDEASSSVKNRVSLLDRLQQQIILLTRELVRKESKLPVSPKEKKTIEAQSPVSMQFEGGEVYSQKISEKRCLATTLSQALLLPSRSLSLFDVVCIDDTHTLRLPEFFYCTSLAKEQCYILADVTEQPPQSVSQTDASRTWLQKNYFTYFQETAGDENRFTVGVLPPDVVSELVLPDEIPTIFELNLSAAVSGMPAVKQGKGKIYFIDTTEHRTISEQYIGRKKILPFNEFHGGKVVECIKHALLNGATAQEDILIVTPPSGQSLYLREHLKANQFDSIEIATFGSIRLTTKNTIIVDLTAAGIDFTIRQLDDRKFGKVEIADSLNTLLSTVSEELYVIADLSHFQTRYKGRLLTSLLERFREVSEHTAVIQNTARRFDDLTPEFRKMVVRYSPNEKKSPDYETRLQQSKPSALAPSQSAPAQTIAVADRKLLNDIRTAALRVLAKREIINSIAQYLESHPLYQSTPKTIAWYAALPDLACDNENEFKEVMEMWNLLIYETSDANKSKHPLADKAKVDAKISADLKQIHSYYHSDLEMIVEEGKHKLAQSIQKIFNDCIGKKPVTPADWRNAYLVFLSRMEKYLETVVNQIRM